MEARVSKYTWEEIVESQDFEHGQEFVKAEVADQLAEAIQYYFDMLEEVRGPDWADKPDHVLQKMLKALKNYQEGE